MDSWPSIPAIAVVEPAIAVVAYSDRLVPFEEPSLPVVASQPLEANPAAAANSSP